MAESPIPDKSIYVSLSIKIEGKEIDDTYQVKEVETFKAVNRIPKAHILIYDGSVSKSDFEISNSETFLPGKSVEIKAGYESGSETIFKGLIIKHELQLRRGKNFLMVECRDDTIKMTTVRKNGFFTEMKDSDVISKLIGDAGLQADVESTAVDLSEVVQYYVSDWDFILIRAERNGLLVMVSDGTVSVQKPDLSSNPDLKLTYGIDIIDFNAVMNAENQVDSVKSFSWDIDNQSLIEGDANTPESVQGNVSVTNLSEAVSAPDYRQQSAGLFEKKQLEDWSASKLMRTSISAYKCRFKFQGNEKATVGSMIEIAGMGNRFNGNAFISSVRHVIKGGDWQTEVHTGMDSDWFSEEVMNIESPPAAGLNASVQGFHYGVVKQIHEDPESQFRVLVELPLMENQDDGIWARLATFYASSDFGAYFMPEQGDEVIVGFMNDDPDFPVIIGSLYSKKRKPTSDYTPDEKNTKKAIVTSSLLTVEFDDENKIITIKTPAENIICISDKDESITITDQHKNSGTFSADGISLDSKSDISIKAAGNIDVHAGGNLTMKADANVDVSGMQISNSADTSFSAKGNATAELSTSGQCTVKGAMVMIN